MSNSVFLKAINIINEKGWTQGRYYREYPEETTRYGLQPSGYCLVGACARASHSTVNDFEKSQEFNLLTKASKGYLPSWYNDIKLRSKDEAIEVLRKAYEYECELANPTADSSVPQV